VRATYNRGSVKLAPHILYKRDDALFLDAVTLERDGRTPRELKLGAFRLSGLTNLSATFEKFDPMLPLSVESEKYAEFIASAV
jgi:hypothetical protein